MDAYLKTEHLDAGTTEKPSCTTFVFVCSAAESSRSSDPMAPVNPPFSKRSSPQLPAIGGSVVLDGQDLRKQSRSDIARRMAILMTARMNPRADELPRCGKLRQIPLHRKARRSARGRQADRRRKPSADRMRSTLPISPSSAVSDGQRQRILLARALCQQPELIVLDEPTSFLDIRYKLELLSILKRMVREKDLAVLMSLHELDLAARVSDTVVCVAGDRIDKVGPPEEIFTRDTSQNSITWSRANTTRALPHWTLFLEGYYG